MEVLMSNWAAVQSMPANYVFPPEKRPGEQTFPNWNDIPIIDLQKFDGLERCEIIQQIMKACQDFGIFQVINHGVSEGLMEDAVNVMMEFFTTPADYKASFYSTDMKKRCRIYSSTLDYDKEQVHFWRDNFTHHCHPVEDNIESWPEKPARYRDVISTYCVEARKFLFTILDLIRQGLGLKPGYFEDKYTKTQLISVNYHIPCPDPSLTLGTPEHFDPNIITMIHQLSVPGLQVFKDGEWVGVQTLPNALLVIPGLQLKIITNDLFTSPLHRVVAHAREIRCTLSSFLLPSNDVLIMPAEALIKKGNPPVYKAFTYTEFFSAYSDQKRWDAVLDSFKNQQE